LLSVPAALLSGFFASLAALLLLAGELVWALDGCLLSDFISSADFDPFISPLSWAVAPLFEGGGVSAVDALGAPAGELLSAFGDGAGLSAFDGDALSLFGAALSDFCAGASPPFVPCASAWPAPNTSARAATELNSEFFIWISSMDRTDDRFAVSKRGFLKKGSEPET
jgi:hypothetical protein